MIDDDYKCGSIDCNGDFLWISGVKRCGYGFISSKDNNTYLNLTCTKNELGNAVNNALSKTVSYEYSKEIDDFLMEEARIDKKETDLYRNMMSCSITLHNKTLEIAPSKQVRGGWNGLGVESHMLLKSDASAELIGAAACFAFTRCQGKGRDIVINALFPDGKPNSLEEYLASVNSDYKKWVSPVKVEKIFICDTNPAITLLLRNDCQTSFGLMNDKKRYFIHHGGFGSIPGVEAPKDYKGIPLLKGLYINALEMSDDEIIQALDDSFGCNVTVEDVE
jgi:hypothetical protein